MNIKSYLAALGVLSLSVCVGGFDARSAYAEGSQDLVSSGGDRPYLEYRPGVNGGINRQTTMKVYAAVGETINLGSSAAGRGTTGEIRYRRPNGTAGTCGRTGPNIGLIANRAQEVAGPGNGSNSTFVPCQVNVVSASDQGIWEIEFISPNSNSTANPPPQLGTTNWNQPTSVGYVSAWDITVANTASNAPISGRVYANYYAFNVGGNTGNGNIRGLSSLFYVLTRRGYRYRVDLNGLDPFGFIFFSNRNGFYDQTTDDPIFRSLQFIGANPGALPPGFAFQNPNAADSGPFATNKTFINEPDSSMPSSANSPTGSTWLYNIPTAPQQPTNFQFEGEEGTIGQAGTNPLGGVLSFDSPVANSYSIVLDLNDNGFFGDGIDRTLLGRADIGPNNVPWDGLDGDGNSVPAGDTAYDVRINLYAGEAHFPMIDAEQNPNGIEILLENPPAGGSISANPSDIYYDDRYSGDPSDYTVCATGENTADPECYGGGPDPRQAVTGIDSSGGAHEFTSNFGDRRGIDTWVYYPSADLDISDVIVLKEADLVVNKTVSVASAQPGDDLTYTITVTNDGPSDEPDITFEDVVPPEIENVNWTCEITTGPGSCAVDSGSGNNINTTIDLNNGSVATFTVTGFIAWTASGTITNQAEVTRSEDITDPDLTNNLDSAVTTIPTQPAAANVLIVKRITAINGQSSNPNDGTNLNQFVDDSVAPYGSYDNHPNWPSNYLIGELNAGAIKPGDELEYTVYFLSSGSLDAEDVRLCDRLTPDQAFLENAYGPGVAAQLQLGTAAVIGLTGVSDGSDRAQIIAPSSPVAATCNLQGPNDDGTLLIDVTGATGTGDPDLTVLPASTGTGTPNDAYGLFRFKTRVTP